MEYVSKYPQSMIRAYRLMRMREGFMLCKHSTRLYLMTTEPAWYRQLLEASANAIYGKFGGWS